jgi:HSP20 family molecular chaperone IbpA
MQVKGLKQIKTLSSKRRFRGKSNLNRISSLKVIKQSQFSCGTRQQAYSPKTWVFIAEPKFVRYRQNLLIERSQEPLTELFEEIESAIIIAEIPGVMRTDDVNLTVEGDILILEAIARGKQANRKYFKEIISPFQIKEQDIVYSLNNGLIEIKLFPLTRRQK